MNQRDYISMYFPVFTSSNLGFRLNCKTAHRSFPLTQRMNPRLHHCPWIADQFRGCCRANHVLVQRTHRTRRLHLSSGAHDQCLPRSPRWKIHQSHHRIQWPSPRFELAQARTSRRRRLHRIRQSPDCLSQWRHPRRVAIVRSQTRNAFPHHRS